MGGVKKSLIIIGPALLAGLIALRLRRDEPVATNTSQAPSFHRPRELQGAAAASAALSRQHRSEACRLS
jgi:hypothetical protein